MVFVDVIGEDLRRFDWREVGVDLAGESARFRGVELEDALGKWDFRWGMFKGSLYAQMVTSRDVIAAMKVSQSIGRSLLLSNTETR